MSHPVRILQVRRRQEERHFLELPYRLYAGDHGWVAPLRKTERERWNPARNSALRSRRVKRLLALRGRQVVGRIAAVEDRAFASAWHPQCGFFGFFECAEDRDAAQALFQAAEDTFHRWGLTSVVGPVNLTTNQEVGFLVEGWGRRPSILSPYNPPYYAEMAADAGYSPMRDYLAYRWTPDSSPALSVQRLSRMANRRVAGQPGVRVRAVKDDEWDSEVKTLHRMYNQAFSDLWGFVPMSREEFLHQAESFRPFYEPSLVVIAEDGDGPAGFAVVLPDLNEVLSRLNGRFFPGGWLTLLRGMRRIRTTRFLILGVLPRARGRGIATLMSLQLARTAREKGVISSELALIQSSNRQMIHVVEAMGCGLARRFRLFGKELRGNPLGGGFDCSKRKSDESPRDESPWEEDWEWDRIE